MQPHNAGASSNTEKKDAKRALPPSRSIKEIDFNAALNIGPPKPLIAIVSQCLGICNKDIAPVSISSAHSGHCGC